MRPVVELQEYERQRLSLTPDQLTALVAAVNDRLTVTPTSEKNVYELAASSWVGTAVIDDLSILIRPKIPLDNLFLLLGVGLPAQAWRPETFDYGERPDLLAAFATFFGRTLERTLSRGLRRDYQEMATPVSALRGRLDIPRLVRSSATAQVPCRYDEFTEDIAENRALRAATVRLLRVPGLPSDTRRTLLREVARFEGVSDVRVTASDIDDINITRLNRHYEPALRLAALILRNMTLADDPGPARASAFLLDMNALFQDFVTDRLKSTLRGRLDVLSEPPASLDLDGAVSMRPDLEFRIEGRVTHVADIKYKLLARDRGSSDDYYQLLAYTTALGVPSGTLIYADVDRSPPAEAVRVRNSNKRLLAYRLNLTGDRTAIDHSIDGLAYWLIEQGAAVHERSA